MSAAGRCCGPSSRSARSSGGRCWRCGTRGAATRSQTTSRTWPCCPTGSRCPAGSATSPTPWRKGGGPRRARTPVCANGATRLLPGTRRTPPSSSSFTSAGSRTPALLHFYRHGVSTARGATAAPGTRIAALGQPVRESSQPTLVAMGFFGTAVRLALGFVVLAHFILIRWLRKISHWH